MSKIIVINLIVLWFCFNLAQTQDNLSKSDWNAINEWSKLGITISKVSIQQPKAIISASEDLGRAIPTLTGIFKPLMIISSSFLPRFEKIKKNLIEMDNRLFEAENKIDILSKQIKYVSAINCYKYQAININVVNDFFLRYVSDPTNITRITLVWKCNKIIEYINCFIRDSTRAKIYQLIDVMKDDYNMKNFQYWSKMLLSGTAQAMFLHTICMAVEHPNNEDFNKSMTFHLNRFNKIAYKLSQIFNYGFVDIERNFFETAKNEIHNYALAHQSESHRGFATNVYKMLKDKYYWRNWIVGSYSDLTWGWEKHTVCCSNYRFVLIRERYFERNIFISSTNNSLNFQNVLDKCLDKWRPIIEVKLQLLGIYSKKSSHIIYEILDKCIGNHNGLGVVQNGNDFFAWIDHDKIAYRYVPLLVQKDKYYILRPYMNNFYKQFDVFAVAPILTPNIRNETCQN